MIGAAHQLLVTLMMSLPVLRRTALPTPTGTEAREAFLHIALVGMTITVTALLGYIAMRDADETPAHDLPSLR